MNKPGSLEDIREFLNSPDIRAQNFARMRYHGGLMELVEITDCKRVLHCRIDLIWTSWWNKKWRSLSDEEFLVWMLPKVKQWLLSFNDTPSTYYAEFDEIRTC